jgi:hypothetical protein
VGLPRRCEGESSITSTFVTRTSLPRHLSDFPPSGEAVHPVHALYGALPHRENGGGVTVSREQAGDLKASLLHDLCRISLLYKTEEERINPETAATLAAFQANAERVGINGSGGRVRTLLARLPRRKVR